MDRKLEMKIRKLGSTPRKILKYVILSGPAPSPASNVGSIKLKDREKGGGYSVLVRNDLIVPVGRDGGGKIMWEAVDEISENREEVLSLMKKLNEK